MTEFLSRKRCWDAFLGFSDWNLPGVATALNCFALGPNYCILKLHAGKDLLSDRKTLLPQHHVPDICVILFPQNVCLLLFYLILFLSSPEDTSSLLLRERGWERGWERETSMWEGSIWVGWLAASCLYPDRESNPQPFGYGTMLNHLSQTGQGSMSSF